jgi:uncharacterized protein (TIGR02266 family)
MRHAGEPDHPTQESNFHPTIQRWVRGQNPRVDITVDAASDHNFWSGITMEVERGGVFVATYQTLRIGTVVEMLVHLPGEEAPISAVGVVRWTRPYLEGSDGAPGIGIKFTELPAAARDAVGRFAEHVRAPMMFELDEPPLRKRRYASSAPPPSA